MARKNRDADYVACNFMWGNKPLTDEERLDLIDYAEVKRLMENEPSFRVPEYVYDKHTYRGKKNGKTTLDFFQEENEALEPRQLSLFDNASYGEYYKRSLESGYEPTPAYDRAWRNFISGKESDPTHNGRDFPEAQ